MKDIIEFLTELYDKGNGYSTLNLARSSLSSIGISIESHPAGSHPLIIRFMKGVFNLRPPKPRYSKIWDVNVVLNYLRKLSPVKQLTLKDLTLKLVMLMGLTNAARVDTLSKLSISNIQKLKSEYVLQIDGLLKQSRPGHDFSTLSFKAFPSDRRICVYFVLKEYLRRTKPLREKNHTRLFISYVKPHSPVTTSTISRWIKVVMARAGIDIADYGAHSVRAAATSKATEQAVPIQEILQVAGWSNAGTFRKFYNKPVQNQSTFATAVLRS